MMILLLVYTDDYALSIYINFVVVAFVPFVAMSYYMLLLLLMLLLIVVVIVDSC